MITQCMFADCLRHGIMHCDSLLYISTITVIVQVNVLGVCVFTREFMTQLKERGVDEGHIININRYCRII